MVFLALPLQATAAGNPLEKVVTLTGTSEEDYTKQAEQVFAQEIREDGKNYTLSGISCEITDTKYLDKKEKTVDIRRQIW